MSDDITIREASAADLDAVLGLYEASGLDDPGENDRAAARVFFSQILATGGRVLVASNASRTAAHAFYERLGFTRHGLSFAVSLTEEVAA